MDMIDTVRTKAAFNEAEKTPYQIHFQLVTAHTKGHESTDAFLKELIRPCMKTREGKLMKVLSLTEDGVTKR